MEQLYCASRVVFFIFFFAVLFFDPNSPFFKGCIAIDFCQFSKWSDFSNISCFLEPFFAWNNFIVPLESFSVFFLQF